MNNITLLSVVCLTLPYFSALSQKYLGSLLTDDGRCTCEIKSRIAMAKAAFNKKKNLFSSKLDLNLRKKLVKCYIWSVANWIGHILRRNCLLKEVIEGKIQGQKEVTRIRGRRRKKLVDDLGDRRGYSHLKEEAVDRIKRRNRFGRGCGPVV
jgi:hypothetical protein